MISCAAKSSAEKTMSAEYAATVKSPTFTVPPNRSVPPSIVMPPTFSADENFSLPPERYKFSTATSVFIINSPLFTARLPIAMSALPSRSFSKPWREPLADL